MTNTISKAQVEAAAKVWWDNVNSAEWEDAHRPYREKYMTVAREALTAAAQAAPRTEAERHLCPGGLYCDMAYGCAYSPPCPYSVRLKETRDKFTAAAQAAPPTEADMRAFGASEAACYKWPDDTPEHKTARAAYCQGAADYGGAPLSPASNVTNGWQPIETAPKDGTDILLWLHPEFDYGCVVGRYRLNTLFGPTWDFEDGHSVVIEGATHWQPIPAPPVTAARIEQSCPSCGREAPEGSGDICPYCDDAD